MEKIVYKKTEKIEKKVKNGLGKQPFLSKE